MKKTVYLALVFLTLGVHAQDKVIKLYEGVIPNSKQAVDYNEIIDVSKDKSIRIKKIIDPELLVYYPRKEKANGTAVLICPGGGYGYVSMTNEGYEIAQKLIDNGFTAFILKYRLPSDEIMDDKTIGPLQDTQQAIKIIREEAAVHHIDTSKLGIMGFSAGGHLASTTGTHFNQVVIDNPNKTNLRPDFMVLVYPVISFGKFQHKGTRTHLIGGNPTEEMTRLYSNEFQVNEETPMTFLVHALDDKVVPFQNSVAFLEALNINGVKSEMHLYQEGGHGFGLNIRSTKESWFDSMLNWLSSNKLIP